KSPSAASTSCSTMGLHSTLSSAGGKRFAVALAARVARPRRGRSRGSRPPAPAALPLHAAAQLHERPERPRLLRGPVPPLLPPQPVRRPVGTHELGPRGEHGPRPLAAPAGGPPPAGRGHDLLRHRGRGPDPHHP